MASACTAVCFLALLLLSQRVSGLQQAEAGGSRKASAGVYSTEQANRGQSVYLAQCAQCHGEPLAGTEFGPALIGNTFATDFNGLTVGDLFDRIQTTMPQSNPGGLSRAEALDVIAYVLKSNDFPAGGMVLPAEPAMLKSITIDLKKPDERLKR
jgi:mono/diheme cytochrome c family protein